jgi:hypothetical protein
MTWTKFEPVALIEAQARLARAEKAGYADDPRWLHSMLRDLLMYAQNCGGVEIQLAYAARDGGVHVQTGRLQSEQARAEAAVATSDAEDRDG